MPVPQNAQSIWSFLTGKGISANGAAGILGNIEQESGGNPESVGSGGGGLIGFTPLPPGYVTGNASADLQKQLTAVMNYIGQNGSVSDINAHAASPTAAADWFMTKYERPKAGPTANQSNREQSAVATAQAAQSGKWPANANLTSASASGGSGGISTTGINIGGSDPFGIGGIFQGLINSFFKSLGVPSLKDMLQRLGLIILGVVLIAVGIHVFSKGTTSPFKVESDTHENVNEDTGEKTVTSKSNTRTPIGSHKATKTVRSGGLADEAIEAAAVALCLSLLTR